ncbi:hypothetical protein J6590_045745 [Homalodisca vitripennis]|nr:hypothetical protein J6590_045745 [Homalodisca vitripennis]
MLIGCSPVTSHHATTLQPTVQAGQPAVLPESTTRHRHRVQCRPAYITVATRKTTATVERRLQWRRGKQLQQWNVAYSGDEENNCNSGTSLTVATRKTTATVNYSDLVRTGNKRNEHVQITTNVQGHSGH